MGKMVYAAKGWKSLQKDYIARDLLALQTEKLNTVLREDISGFSFEEMTIHYTAMGHAAMQVGIAGYVQTGSLENAESYFCLASLAKRTGGRLLTANPHKQISQGHRIPLDYAALAVLCGCDSIAIDILETTALTFEYAQKQPQKSRRDQRQNDLQNQRVLLEIEFYTNLLQNRDAAAVQLLPKLDELPGEGLTLQAMRAFSELDNDRFFDALLQHMKAFRSTPYPEELNYFVLLMEALYQKRKPCRSLDLADAPAALLELPACDPERLEEKLGIPLPVFDMDVLLGKIDPNKTGPKFKQY